MNTERRHFGGQRFGHAFHGEFGCFVNAGSGHGHEAGHAAHGQNVAAALRAHNRNGGLHHGQSAEYIGFESGAGVVDFSFFNGGHVAEAGVGNHHIQAAEMLLHLRHGGKHGLAVGHIQHQRQESIAVGLFQFVQCA